MQKTFIIHQESIINNVSLLLSQNWKQFKERDEVLEVTISIHKTKRNLEQNKLLHAMLSEIASQAWVNGRQYNAETWKEFFKRKFLGVVELPNGQEMAVSTSKLKVKAFAEFVQQVEAYAVSELLVCFPDK